MIKLKIYLQCFKVFEVQSITGFVVKVSSSALIIRDHGPPTLFLTFSCAEYVSSDITEYLKRVNGITVSLESKH